MHDVCFKAGLLTIHWYGVMMAFAFMAGMASMSLVGRKEGRDFAFCSDLVFWVMVSGLAGARIAYVCTDLRGFLADPVSILRIDRGGLIYYGGFVGATAGLTVFARVKRVRLMPVLDLVATALPLSHALGRVGCFLHGCCYGALGSGALSVRYPMDSPPWIDQVYAGKLPHSCPWSLPVHPVQLYEFAFNLCLYGVLVCIYRARKRDGIVVASYLLIYPVGRFFLELLRGDARVDWLGLSVAQWMSLALFLAGCGLWLWSRRKQCLIAGPGTGVAHDAPGG